MIYVYLFKKKKSYKYQGILKTSGQITVKGKNWSLTQGLGKQLDSYSYLAGIYKMEGWCRLNELQFVDLQNTRVTET